MAVDCSEPGEIRAEYQHGNDHVTPDSLVQLSTVVGRRVQGYTLWDKIAAGVLGHQLKE